MDHTDPNINNCNECIFLQFVYLNIYAYKILILYISLSQQVTVSSWPHKYLFQ